jgi:hypothetical protein
MLFDSSVAADVPKLFIPTTVNVYDVPGVRPVTVIGELDADAVILPGLDVAVNVFGKPPPEPSVKVIVAAPPVVEYDLLVPAFVAVPMVGIAIGADEAYHPNEV